MRVQVPPWAPHQTFGYLLFPLMNFDIESGYLLLNALKSLVWCLGTQPTMFYVYVLKSKKDDKCYIGSTTDLRRRFKEHNKGLVSSTKPRRPLELIYYEAYASEEDARRRESNLKLKSRAYAQLYKRIENSKKA